MSTNLHEQSSSFNILKGKNSCSKWALHSLNVRHTFHETTFTYWAIHTHAPDVLFLFRHLSPLESALHLSGPYKSPIRTERRGFWQHVLYVRDHLTLATFTKSVIGNCIYWQMWLWNCPVHTTAYRSSSNTA